jgi:hypothetical protein
MPSTIAETHADLGVSDQNSEMLKSVSPSALYSSELVHVFLSVEDAYFCAKKARERALVHIIRFFISHQTLATLSLNFIPA